MRVDSIAFANANQAANKEPRYIIEIDFTDEILRLTGNSDTPVPSDGNDVIHGAFKILSSTSQEVDPQNGKSTIGAVSFEAVDLSDAISTKIRTKLSVDSIGLNGKTVSFKYGYKDLAYADYETVQTQQIRTVLQDGKRVIFRCNDIQRAAKKQIFDEVKTTLAADLTDTATVVNVFDTSRFYMVEHGTSYSDAPSATVGYLEIKQGDKREIVRYTGKSASQFTGLTRGVLGTRAQSFTFDSGGSDNGITVRQYVYLEMPVLKLAYALLTGDLLGQGSATLPDEWHLGIPDTWIAAGEFQIHDDLYDATDDTKGFIVRLEGVPRSDGKAFIERELMLLAGCFMPVKADGSLGIRRMADIQPNAGYAGVLDLTNITKYSSIEHSMQEVFNKLEIQWNYNTNKKEFSRTNILEDAVSQATHGVSATKRMKFRGLYGSIHSQSILDTLFNVTRDRFAGPPLRLQVDCLPSMNVYEVGDVIRVRIPVQDFSGTGTVDRSFEIQKRTINWITGKVTFKLFASSQRASLKTPNATSFIADGFYTAGLLLAHELNATNFPGNVSSSGGITTITGNITLNGDNDMNAQAAIYWCSEPLTINSGVTISIDRNVQLRVKGHITFNGKIDGVAGAVVTSLTGYCGPTVEAQWGIDIDTGSGSDYYKAVSTDMATPLQRSPQYATVPFLDIEQDAVNGITSGIPGDLRGISGAQGGRIYHVDLAAQQAAGGAGGTGGAGLAIISRGGSFGGSGEIDLSGGPGLQGGTHTSTGKQLHAGCGSPGGPGTCFWIVDGQSSTIPTLSLNFVGKCGAVDLNGSEPELTADPVRHPEPGEASTDTSAALGLAPARADGRPQDTTQVDVSQSVQRVQVVAGHVAANADVDEGNPAALALVDEVDFATQVTGAEKPENNSTRNRITGGVGVPTGGSDGDLYYRTTNGQWWWNDFAVWKKVSDETALNQAATIASQGALATEDTADFLTQVSGTEKPESNATQNAITSGSGVPSGGSSGDLYYRTTSSQWWANILGTWTKVSDETAVNVAASIASQGALATKDTADFSTDVSGSTKPEDNATQNAITTGSGVPSGGSAGDLYRRTTNGQWWANIAGTWTKVSDETALNIAASITGQGSLATKNTVGTSDIDNDAVTNTKIGTSAVDTNEVSADAITAAGFDLHNFASSPTAEVTVTGVEPGATVIFWCHGWVNDDGVNPSNWDFFIRSQLNGGSNIDERHELGTYDDVNIIHVRTNSAGGDRDIKCQAWCLTDASAAPASHTYVNQGRVHVVAFHGRR